MNNAAPEVDLESYREQERQSFKNPKNLNQIGYQILKVLSVIMVVFHVYTAYAGNFVTQSAIHFLFALTLVFFVYPFRKKENPTRVDAVMDKLDIVFAVLAIILNAYFIYHAERIIVELGYLTPTSMDILMSFITLILLYEGGRRATGGLLFPNLALIATLYTVFGNMLVNVPFLAQFAHRGIGFEDFAIEMYMGQKGIFQADLLATGAQTIAIFLIFGSVLLLTGGGEVFILLSTAIAGRLVGGPAKVATLSSGLFGTISGSTAANVATTGVFSIPLMKRYGYKPKFAGAVEAAASCGGQILPPIMGAAAFVLAEVAQVDYFKVAAAAVIPALLYYFGVWMSVHFEAKRLGLKPIEKSEMPKVRDVIFSANAPALFIPLFVLITTLFMGMTPVRCAFWAVIAAVVVFLIQSTIQGKVKEALFKLVDACVDGARTMVMIALILAVAQVVASVIGITGVGAKISAMLASFGQESLLLTVFFGMVLTILLGMGVPTVAAYMLSASVIYPAFAAVGLPLLASHLFILYFAILSGITPPVALAAMVGGGIAGSKALETAITACKIGLAGFLIPYMFLFNPALLGEGEWLTILWSVGTAIVGVTALAGSTIGFVAAPLHWVTRLILLATAIMLIHPGWMTDIAGFVILGVVYFGQMASVKKNKVETNEKIAV
ncbi:TRAP transporter fused permease subunit [Ammoniphilus sp. YIM 78166]|uniref:TRAP transporter permease n=1 Tax=Ammoniphilus sp. YIM 78166 TaxID=1644106 RepID=UPI0014307C5E|nr:TRAP transporter fused permease subunit [Ammoniphilus sp. YIM 78166]